MMLPNSIAGRWLLSALCCCCPLGLSAAELVNVVRTPYEGIQPQAAIDESGTVHLIYFKGRDAAGDVFYVRRGANEPEFSAPIRVNSWSGSAIAVGTIRGAQLALGKSGRVHVLWNGSGDAKTDAGQSALFYTRLQDDGRSFEPQRNVIQEAYGLDGGSSVAADAHGNVYVTWHGNPAKNGEANRRIYFRASNDDGLNFSQEKPIDAPQQGVCGCCGMRAFADPQGTLFVIYRTARENVHRDMRLLVSKDRGETFTARPVDNWQVTNCPMSSETFAASARGVFGAWETDGQVVLAAVDEQRSGSQSKISPPGSMKGRKHPAIAINGQGDVLLAWTEGTGWQRGGSLSWQVFDAKGKATRNKGRAEGVPVWGLPTAIALPDGNFTIVY